MPYCATEQTEESEGYEGVFGGVVGEGRVPLGMQVEAPDDCG